MQVGSPEVVAAIAQRALAVIYEAAQITHAHGHTTPSSSSKSQGSDSMPGKQGVAHNGGGSQADASTPAMPSMSGSSTATSYSDSPKHRSLSGSGGVTSNPTSSKQGADNMGGGSSAIYSQGPRQGSNSKDKQVAFWLKATSHIGLGSEHSVKHASVCQSVYVSACR